MSAFQTAYPVLPLPVPAAAKSVPRRAALSPGCALLPRIFPRILPDKSPPPSARTAFSPQDPTIPAVRCRDPPGIPPRPPPYPAVFRRHRHSCDSWTPGRHFSPKLQIIVIRRVVRRKIQRVNIALREQSAGTRRVKPPAGIAGRGSRQQHAALLRLDLKFLSSRIDRHMQLAAACRAEISHEVKIIPDPALSPLAHRDVRPGELRLARFQTTLCQSPPSFVSSSSGWVCSSSCAVWITSS